MGSLSGAERLLKSNIDVQRSTQNGGKPFVECKDKSRLEIIFEDEYDNLKERPSDPQYSLVLRIEVTEKLPQG